MKSGYKHIKDTFETLPLEIKFILIEFINQIQKIKNIKEVILFGSYTKLIYHRDSDIDIVIILIFIVSDISGLKVCNDVILAGL